MAGRDDISPAAVEDVKRGLLDMDGAASARSGRFRPGQSGNPEGRPKRMPDPMPSPGEGSLHAATVRLARTPVPIKENGTSRSIPMYEAVLRAQMSTAVKGNALAQRDALARMERALWEAVRNLQEEREFWRRYRDEKRAEIQQARRNGTAVPSPLPHPDDIVIEPGQEVRIEGPIDEADMARCARTCLFRDTLLLQDALDMRLASDNPGDGYRPGGSLIWAFAVDNLAYKRFRLSEGEWLRRMLRNASMPRRALLKTLHQAWRALGMAVPRGTRFESNDVVAAIFHCSGEIADAVRAGDIDQDEFLRREFNETALEIMARFRARSSS